MKKRSVVIIIALLAILEISCKQSSMTSEKSPGELVFKSRCQTCHRLPKPDSKTVEEWPGLIDRYGVRANLTDEQKELLIAYLTPSKEK